MRPTPYHSAPSTKPSSKGASVTADSGHLLAFPAMGPGHPEPATAWVARLGIASPVLEGTGGPGVLVIGASVLPRDRGRGHGDGAAESGWCGRRWGRIGRGSAGPGGPIDGCLSAGRRGGAASPPGASRSWLDGRGCHHGRDPGRVWEARCGPDTDGAPLTPGRDGAARARRLYGRGLDRRGCRWLRLIELTGSVADHRCHRSRLPLADAVGVGTGWGPW